MSTAAKHEVVGMDQLLGRGIELTNTVGRAVLKSLAAYARTMRMARMTQVLSSMTDEELARIGITRRQVPAYAAKLADERS